MRVACLLLIAAMAGCLDAEPGPQTEPHTEENQPSKQFTFSLDDCQQFWGWFNVNDDAFAHMVPEGFSYDSQAGYTRLVAGFTECQRSGLGESPGTAMYRDAGLHLRVESPAPDENWSDFLTIYRAIEHPEIASALQTAGAPVAAATIEFPSLEVAGPAAWSVTADDWSLSVTAGQVTAAGGVFPGNMRGWLMDGEPVGVLDWVQEMGVIEAVSGATLTINGQPTDALPTEASIFRWPSAVITYVPLDEAAWWPY